MQRLARRFRMTLLTLVALLVPLSAGAQERLTGITNMAEFDDFLKHYYLEPRPDLVESAMTFVSASGLAADPRTSSTLPMFFTCIFSRHEEQRVAWAASIQGFEEPARKLLTDAMQQRPAELLAATPTSPAKNDMNLMCYFVTGDVQYIESVIEGLRHLEEREDVNLLLTAASAKWALAVISKSDLRVRARIETLRDQGTPEMRCIAQDILAQPVEDILKDIPRVLVEIERKGA